MKSKSVALILATGMVSLCSTANAQSVLFSDDFESGNLNLWTQGTSALAISNTNNISPLGGMYSAYADASADRMYHNLGQEVSGYFKLTVSIYDSTMTRTYAQALAYSGSGYGSGTLEQLFAIGKYNAVNLPGETYDPTKYQARVLYGTSAGWFNLNAEGAPSRSTGWHEFTVERLGDSSTLNFFVDGILGRTITGATLANLDSLSLGFGSSSSSNGDTFYDGVACVVPEPSAITLSGLAGLGLLGWRARRRLA